MSSAELLGRKEELAAVEGLFSENSSGPQMLMLEGVAGIGKTAVWLSGVESARRHGFRALLCRPSPTEMPLAFSALGDVLADLTGEYLPQLPPPQRIALEISLLLRDSEGAAPDQRAVSLATMTLLRTAAEKEPLLIAIDDVQWLDSPSARVLAFVFRRVEQERCRVLLTRRLELEDGSASGFPVELELAPRSMKTLERRTLGPLSLGALQNVIRTHLSAHLPRQVLVSICEAAGGNPFYALELARAQLERGAIEPGQPLQVPESLVALIRERLSSLPASMQETLLIASALSEPTVGLLQSAAGSSLDNAIENGVVELDGERVRFTHSLLASVLYAQATPESRGELHRRLATIAPSAAERARHLALGSDSPDAEVAAELDAAAGREASRGAPDAAAELYEHAARLTPPEARDDARRRRTEAASHYFQAGDIGRARALAEEMLAEPDEGPWRADVLVLLADIVDDRQEAVDLCLQAVEEADGDEDRLTKSYLSLGRASSIQGDFAGQVDAQKKALVHAKRGNNKRLLVEALQGVGNVTVLSGGAIDEKIMQQAIAIDRDEAAMPAFHGPSFWYGMQLYWMDALEQARPILSSELERARHEGDLVDSLEILSPLIEIELRCGSWDLAGRMTDEGLEQALYIGQEYIIRSLSFQHLQLAVLRGEVSESRHGLAERVVQAERLNDHWQRLALMSLAGFFELSLGDAREAWRWLEPALRLQDELGRDISVAMPLYTIRPNAIETLIALDELDRAERLLESFEAHVEKTRRPNGIVSSARSRALVEASRGNLESAREALERAIAGHETLPDPFERGRTLLIAGTIERRAKQKRNARQALEEAIAVFGGLGARLWCEKAQVELGRVAGFRAGELDLTATEQQVAELVARGRSNKEVAAQLFMSVRTVEATLSKIYRKLGLESRSELASHLRSDDL